MLVLTLILIEVLLLIILAVFPVHVHLLLHVILVVRAVMLLGSTFVSELLVCTHFEKTLSKVALNTLLFKL